MKKVIFIIEKKPVHLSGLCNFVSTKYDIFMYREGRAAFRASLREKPDLILIDAQIPDIDAHELCRLFKEHQALTKTRIVMIYPQHEIPESKQWNDFSSDDYRVMPFSEHEFLVCIRVLLKTPRFVIFPEVFPIFDANGIVFHLFPAIALMMA